MDRRPDINKLFRVRQAIGRNHGITPKIERAALDSILGEEERIFQSNLAREKEVLLGSTTQQPLKIIDITKSRLYAQSRERHNLSDKWISPASLAAAYISEQFHDPLLSQAQEHLLIWENIPYFVIAFDAAFGESLIIGSLCFGIEGTVMGHERFMREYVYNSGGTVKPGTSLFSIIDEEQRNKEALYTADSTGFRLIEEAVKLVKREPNRIVKRVEPRAGLVQTYLNIGAEASVRAYKATYPIALLIPPPQAS